MAFRTTPLIFRGALILAVSMGIALISFHTASAQVKLPVVIPAVLPETQPEAKCLTPLEARLIQEGFVNVRTLDPALMVDLKYAKTDNFMGANVYGDFNCAYLRPEAALKLAEASRIIRSRYPHLRILVADALRPRSIQDKMWKLVVNTPRQRYVANPASGSMHNFGAAVDVTLYDITAGKPLDMGTPIDHFGPLAQPALETGYLLSGLLSESHLINRAILRNAMCDAGWHSLRIEWWHFDAFPTEHVRQTYTIIE